MRRFVRIIAMLCGLAGFGYFIHGADQLGLITSFLILDGDAWKDPENGLAFLVMGGIILILATVVVVAINLGDQIRAAQRQSVERGALVRQGDRDA